MKYSQEGTMFSFPSNTKEIIDGIRDAIGRDITFYTPNKVPCTYSGCSIDPVSKVSTLSFCPICHGAGYITTYSGEDVTAHVTWYPAEILNWQTGGRIDTGDCTVQVEYNDDNLELIRDCAYVVVDTKKLTIRKQILRGVPVPNRVILNLLEEE
jgi:hypothetical protein